MRRTLADRLVVVVRHLMGVERRGRLICECSHEQPGFLAVSSGFGPAWRLDGGKIVSLTA